MKVISLHVRMEFVEGALQRLLGLVGRRGFNIAGVEARLSHCGRRYEVSLELTGDRSVQNLERQIAKLHEVETVRALMAAVPLPFRGYVGIVQEARRAAV